MLLLSTLYHYNCYYYYKLKNPHVNSYVNRISSTPGMSISFVMDSGSASGLRALPGREGVGSGCDNPSCMSSGDDRPSGGAGLRDPSGA